MIRATAEQQAASEAFVASSYEEVSRTGRVQRSSMLLNATEQTTLSQLTAAVPDFAIDDLARQFALARRPPPGL